VALPGARSCRPALKAAATSRSWWAWFLARRLNGLGGESFPGCCGPLPDVQVEQAVVRTSARGPGGRRALVQAETGLAGGDLADQRAPQHLARDVSTRSDHLSGRDQSSDCGEP
jgi:hypothetical protein